MQHRFLQHLAKGNRSARKDKPESGSMFLVIFPLLGAAMIIWGFFAPRLGILPFLGFFFILFWAIMTARKYRTKFDILRSEYLARWRNEEQIAVDLKRVCGYTALSLLPLYFLMALPAIMVTIVGELMAWLMIGASSTIISFIVMCSFVTTWKDLYLKLRYYWLMQLFAFVLINGTVALIYLFF